MRFGPRAFGARAAEGGRRAEADGVAEGAEGAADCGVGGDEGRHFRGVEQGAELGGDGGGSGDEAGEPAEGVREGVWRAGAVRALAGAGCVRRGDGEAGEAGGEAADSLPDENDERPGDTVAQPLPGDMGAERFDEGVEAGEEQKTGGCGGWGGHRSKSPMRGWGWARIFVSFVSPPMYQRWRTGLLTTSTLIPPSRLQAGFQFFVTLSAEKIPFGTEMNLI